MDYRTAVCDDSTADRQDICGMVRRWAAASGNRVRIDAFPSAESFLFQYAGDNDYDILLLDVEMPDLSGIDLARRVRAARCRAEIIFITSHFEFIAEGYEVDALHYLMKPVSEQKLFEVLSRAAKKRGEEPPSVIIICDGETVKLFEADILYAEAFAHSIEIHTRDRIYSPRESITAFEERLSDNFYRTHRSYLVNLKAVERISRRDVTVTGGDRIPLARGKYDDIHRAFIERN